MALSTAVDAATESFYAWELRGRGWWLAPYPVDLEPPHRPFLILPVQAPDTTTPIDDGKRPTLLSALVERVQRALRPPPPTPALSPERFEEQEPFPLAFAVALASFTIHVPDGFRSDPELASAIIRAIARIGRPIAFELIGHAGGVCIQLTLSEDDAESVETLLSSYVPEATIVRGEDRLVAHWGSERSHFILDVGLANEFFLPIAIASNFDIDPLIPLIGALAQTRADETLVLQVLFQHTVNGWTKSIQSALVDERGEDVVVDAPTFKGLATEKTSTPLLAVVMRVGANARSSDRTRELIVSTEAYVRQFERAGANSFIALAGDDALADEHEQSFLRRESFRTGMLLSLDELAQLVHVPDRSVANRALMRQTKQSKLLPTEARDHAFILGENMHRGARAAVSIAHEARLAHMHVIGASGVGKSTLLLNLITQDIEQHRGLLVLDPHGDLIDEVIARIPAARNGDVCLLDPADPDHAVGFNVLRATDEIEKNLIASDMIDIFRRLSTSWGDAMTTVLGNAVLALLDHPQSGTLVELRRFLIDSEWRRAYLRQLPDPHVRFFWDKEFPLIGARSIGPILTRLDQFLRPKLLRQIVSQRDGALDLARMVVRKQIVLAKLSQGLIGRENAYLLGSLLISKVHQVALGRQQLSTPLRHPFHCYVDECQHFVTQSMASLLSEARKYGVGFTLAHQTLAQLASTPEVAAALLGNAYTRIVFRVGDDDAKKLSEGFSSFTAHDLRSLARGESIVRMGSAQHDFNLRVLPKSVVADEAAIEQALAVRVQSRSSFAVPRSEVEDVYPVSVGAEPAAPPELRSSPVVPVGPSPQPKISATPRSVTQRIKPNDLPTSGRGGQEHKYLQHLVKRLAEERGFRATIEDPGEGGTSVDVVLRRGDETIGVEISVSTSVEHEIENLKKCAGLDYTRMLFIAKALSKRDRVATAAKTIVGDRPFAAVAPEGLAEYFDRMTLPMEAASSTVRGYSVRVSRTRVTPEDALAKRKAVAGVLARVTKGG